MALCPTDCTPSDPLIPVCDDAEYCEELITDKCIIHKGDTLANISTTDGDRLDVILTKINTKFGEDPAVTAAQVIVLINASVELRNLIRTVAASPAE